MKHEVKNSLHLLAVEPGKAPCVLCIDPSIKSIGDLEKDIGNALESFHPLSEARNVIFIRDKYDIPMEHRFRKDGEN